MTADTPDPRPVSPPSELTAEEEQVYDWARVGRLPHIALAAAPQADEGRLPINDENGPVSPPSELTAEPLLGLAGALKEGLREAAEAVIALVPRSSREAPTQWQRNADAKADTAIARLRARAAPQADEGLRALPDHIWRYQQGNEHLAGCCVHPGVPFASAPVPAGLDGRAVHREWRDGMLAQGREVAPERMAWETLPEQDRALDEGIAARLRALSQLPEDAP